MQKESNTPTIVLCVAAIIMLLLFATGLFTVDIPDKPLPDVVPAPVPSPVPAPLPPKPEPPKPAPCPGPCPCPSQVDTCPSCQ